MVVEITMFEEGDVCHVSVGDSERHLRVTEVIDDPERGNMLHVPTRILRGETIPRGTKCQVEKLTDGRVRFRYDGSDSPLTVGAAWGKRDPEW